MPRAALNGIGAPDRGLATIVCVATKFTSGAWVVVLIVPVGGISKHTKRACVRHWSLADEVVAISIHLKPRKALPSAPNGNRCTPGSPTIPDQPAGTGRDG